MQERIKAIIKECSSFIDACDDKLQNHKKLIQ